MTSKNVLSICLIGLLSGCIPSSSNRSLSLGSQGLVDTSGEDLQPRNSDTQTPVKPFALSAQKFSDQSVELNWTYRGNGNVFFNVYLNDRPIGDSYQTSLSSIKIASEKVKEKKPERACFFVEANSPLEQSTVKSIEVCLDINYPTPPPTPVVEKDRFTGDIYLIGDSTVDGRTIGWGIGLEKLLKGKHTVIDNARSGKSSRSYWDGHFGWRDKMKEGDLLVIQFGHNDQKYDDPNRYTYANGKTPRFGDYLKRYYDYARSKKAMVVIVTSLERAIFGRDGSLRYSHRTSTGGDYVKAALDFAKSVNTPAIDLNKISREVIKSLGPTRVKKYYIMGAKILRK